MRDADVRRLKGNGVAKDMTEAVQWLRKAASQGHAEAQCELGRCCEKGIGVASSRDDAIRWYAAAKAGNKPAKEALARLGVNE